MNADPWSGPARLRRKAIREPMWKQQELPLKNMPVNYQFDLQSITKMEFLEAVRF